MKRCFAMFVAFLICSAGCAHYEYDITAPPDVSKHAATKVDSIVKIDPIEYRFQTVDNRLVIRAFNTTEEQMQLLGEKSTVVDPDGQSHPLRGGPIAPHSFLKIIIPPPRPQVYDPGPTFGVGVGVGVSNADANRRYPAGYYDPMYDQPRYMYVYDEGNAYLWDWKGEGEARLSLVFQQGDKSIRHEFVLKRRKM